MGVTDTEATRRRRALNADPCNLVYNGPIDDEQPAGSTLSPDGKTMTYGATTAAFANWRELNVGVVSPNDYEIDCENNTNQSIRVIVGNNFADILPGFKGRVLINYTAGSDRVFFQNITANPAGNLVFKKICLVK